MRDVPAAGWLDVSIPLEPGITVWPGDPVLEQERVASLAAGDGADVTRIAMCVHTGTHIDAPRHYLAGGAGVERLPLDAVIGAATVVDAGDRGVMDAELLERASIPAGGRVLLRTRNSRRRWWREPFSDDFVALSEAAAVLLAERRVRLVGVDGPSVGAPDESGHQVHRRLLAAGVWLLEGLDLSGAAAGRYELCCLPLRLVAADGAPARAVLRPLP